MKNNIDDFYIKAYYEMPIEEREHFKNLFKNKSCNNCNNSSCRIPNNEKIGVDSNGNPEGMECIGWNNPYIIGRSKVLKK